MEEIVFIGDWIKDRVLGSGSFGTVVLWKHKKTDERIAIKICKWGDELTAKHRERWTKEVEMLQSCNNPNIVRTKELPDGFVAGLNPANPSRLPILCMEYCSRGDLRQLLNKPENCAGLAEQDVRHILSDVCCAMQFLHHNKITHRDLKPENIVMQELNTGQNNQNHRKITYKLIDLGYAKEIDSNSVCASYVGTLQYLAPEMFYSKTYSNSVDFWSFGLLAFEIICGVRPFLPQMSIVQWMPHVKKKTHDNICVYETFHGDIEYSDEIFPENHVSLPFKLLVEKWLRVALEWDPKLRGRDSPSKVTFNIPSEEKESSSKVIIFNLLDSILKTKIFRIFSVTTFSQHAYEINESTSVSTLKTWILRDTNILIENQILISTTTFTDIANEESVVNFWNEQSNVMAFVYSKIEIVKETVEPLVPKAVRRSLEHPKTLLNYKNCHNLLKGSLYFLMSQMEIYQLLIQGIVSRGESLKQESRQLVLKHNSIDKTIAKLITKEETVMKIVDIGKKHVDNLRENGTATNYLGGFGKLFNDADDVSDKINKLQVAWSQLSVRVQSAARRSNDSLSTDLNNFLFKYNYKTVYMNAMETYKIFRSWDHKESSMSEKLCHAIVKASYDTLKLRSKILKELQLQPFTLKLKDLTIELAKICNIIENATDNINTLYNDLCKVSDELTQCMWNTLSILASDADKVAELPYSVVTIRKTDFDIGGSVSEKCMSVTNGLHDDGKLKSLLEESLKIRKTQTSLKEKLNSQKQIMNQSIFDFSFLNEKE